MKREIRDYLYDILHECEYLMKRSKEINYTDFLENEDLKKAFVRSLEIIGEAARKIPLHIKKRYPDVEWKEIVGMRLTNTGVLTMKSYGEPLKKIYRG